MMVDDVVTIQLLDRDKEPIGKVKGMADPAVIDPVPMVYAGQAYLLQEFYEAVMHGKPPVTTCQDNIKSLGIVFDTVQSFESGEMVRCQA